MTRNLKTVRDFADQGPFTESQIRWWIFGAANNGLQKAGAIVRIGRRIYVDTDGFYDWIDIQNKQGTVAA